jgi:hypothetical protein
VQLPQFRSPLARAVIPVVGGLVVLAFIGLFTWAMAAYISSGEVTTSDRLAPETWPVGNVEYLSELVAEDGPLLFAELGSAVSDRSIVIDHQGTDPLNGWRVRWAYPADKDSTCIVTQQVGTDTFVDCDGRSVSVDDLAIPTEVRPVVVDRVLLEIDLRGLTSD